MVETLAVAAAAGVALLVVGLVGARLRGGSDEKYDDPEAQRAHERAQQCDPGEVAPVGMETTTVVQELVDGGETARVSVEGLYVFVEDVPGDVDETDTIEIKITDHAPDGNAARATFLGRA